MVLRNKLIDDVIGLGQLHNFGKKHAFQVSRIALRLFDQLQKLHRMGNTEKLWLEIAALLHDIGKNQNRQTHHKLARDMIVDCSFLPIGKKERKIVGLIARYHRGNWPSKKHKYFNQLDAESKRYVMKLAAILRIADGLGNGTSKIIQGTACSIRDGEIIIHLKCTKNIDLSKAVRKAALSKVVFDKTLVFDLQIIPASAEKVLNRE
jgi:exopolyphosphatase/guanosine-5'-triphosphate,3'-diphosphate pyrophosphatase